MKIVFKFIVKQAIDIESVETFYFWRHCQQKRFFQERVVLFRSDVDSAHYTTFLVKSYCKKRKI